MTEAKFSFTTKIDGDLLTVRGDSAAEFNVNAEALIASGAIGSAQAIQSVARGHAAVAAPPAPTAAAPAYVTPPLPPEPADPWAGQSGHIPSPPAPAAATGPVCAHGPMTFREGVSARGPWKAHFCPTPKGTPGQCKAVFQ